MKRTVFFLFVAATLVASMFPTATFGQGHNQKHTYRTTTVPLQGTTPEQAFRDSQAGTTLPMWQYTIKSPADGRNYTGWILGRKYGTPGPNASGTTLIPTYVVPLDVQLLDENGDVVRELDPTLPDPGCLNTQLTPTQIVGNSPLFNDSKIHWGGEDIGTTQYVDAQLRAEFWTLVQASVLPWHNKFQGFMLPKETVQVPRQFWTDNGDINCDLYVTVDYNWIDNYLKYTLIPSLANQGVGPTTLPVVLTYQVLQGGAAGYHSGYGQPAQFYSIAEFDSHGDIGVLSHELAEVMNNPLVDNGTPAWGHIGQVPGCQANFEVGDNLTPVQNPEIEMNDFTYHPQEVSFISWFYRSTNWGVGKLYSSNDSLVTDAGEVCSDFEPLVVATPNAGPVGTEVEASLSRFPANTDVTIFFNGEELDTILTDENGNGSLTFDVPDSLDGEKQILANFDNGTGYAWFIVTDLLP